MPKYQALAMPCLGCAQVHTHLQGIILASRDRFTKDTEGGAYAGNVTTAAGYLLSLWLHECRRVFADKLTSHEDKEWVDDTVMKLISENCGQDLVSQVCLPLSLAELFPAKSYYNLCWISNGVHRWLECHTVSISILQMGSVSQAVCLAQT